MRILLIAYSILILSAGNLYAQSLTKKELDDLRGSTISSCFRAQKASAINRDIGDRVIRDYCQCYASIIFPSHTTAEEVITGLAIQRRSGDRAMLDFFLKGRDLYEISENCITSIMKR